MEWRFFHVWDSVGDAEDSCFSSFCMEELFGETLFQCLEYASLFDVVNLEGTKYPHIWRYWEICWSFEVFASWDLVWVVLDLGFYTMYFFIFDFLQSVNSSFWFFCICFRVQFVHHRENDVLLFNKDSITYPKKKRNVDGFTEDLKSYILCRDLTLFESVLCC